MAIQKITSGIIQDGAIAAADIVSVANTAITGNITSSQIAPDQTLNGNVSVTGTLSTPNTFGFKNRIINGGMVIDQRNAGAATANTISGYTLDRWAVFQSVTGKLIVQQNAAAVTPPTGFTNYLGVTSQSAYSVLTGDFYILNQNIEGYNIADLAWGTANAKTITISFWVRSSLTGTFGGALENSAQDRNYPFTYTISVANTWELKSVTIAGDTSGTWLTTNGVGIRVIFGLGVGSTLSGTAGAWSATQYFSATGATSVVGTNGATFYITGVQLEKGSTATSFDFRDYGRELAMCQRYYQVIASGASAYFCSATASTASNAYGVANLPVSMRTSPTGSVVSGTNYYRFLSFDIDDFVNSLTVTGQTPNIVTIQNNTEISQTQGRSGTFTCQNAASFVACQAEL